MRAGRDTHGSAAHERTASWPGVCSTVMSDDDERSRFPAHTSARASGAESTDRQRDARLLRARSGAREVQYFACYMCMCCSVFVGLQSACIYLPRTSAMDFCACTTKMAGSHEDLSVSMNQLQTYFSFNRFPHSSPKRIADLHAHVLRATSFVRLVSQSRM